MQIQNILLVVVSSIVIAVLWIVKWAYPNRFFQNIHVLYIYTGAIIIATVLIYFALNVVSDVCSPGDPGTCNSSTDCNNNGYCTKTDGKCACVCDADHTGEHCETLSVPWDSPHCMGPNTQWKPTKGKNNTCVCPPGNWASGTDPKYGYVQCLQCAGDWGPLAGDNPCSGKWGTSNYLTTNCSKTSENKLAQEKSLIKYTKSSNGVTVTTFGSNSTNNNTNSVCNEYDILAKDAGPNGQKGSVSTVDTCTSPNGLNSCRCATPSERYLCKVTGYLDPNKPAQTCTEANSQRICSSYSCN